MSIEQRDDMYCSKACCQEICYTLSGLDNKLMIHIHFSPMNYGSVVEISHGACV